MFDRQLMFDDAAKHLTQQRRKSSDGAWCLYRGPNGAKCIIGAFLPENGTIYDTMDLHRVIPFIDPKYGTRSDNLADDLFIAELQRLHDLAIDRDGWQSLRRQWFKNFGAFAKKYGLNFSVARRVLTRDDEVPASRTMPAFTEENHDSYVPTCSPGEFLDAQ